MKYRIRKINSRLFLLLPILLVIINHSPVLAEIMTLDDAVEIALEQSPTMKQTKLNLSSSEHDLKANQASLKSQFSLTLTPYQYSKTLKLDEYNSRYYYSEYKKTAAELSVLQPIKWLDGTFRITNNFYWDESSSDRLNIFGDSLGGLDTTRYGGSSQYHNLFRVSYNQPLFTYNRTKMEQKELVLALENAQLNYSIQRLQIENQVTQSFLELYYVQKSSLISKEEYDNAVESYDIIKSKVEAGLSASEELYQAELSMANSRSSMINNQNRLDNAMDNFKVLLGLPLEKEIEISADVHKLFVDVDLEKALKYGLDNRMELRLKDIEIQTAMNNLIRAKSDNEFKASVDLSYGLSNSNDQFDNLFKSPEKDHSIGITFNIPLIDWGRKKHQIASSEAQVESRYISADEERNNIILAIRQAYRDLQNQKAQVEIAETNVKNARLTYELNLERYKNGDLSSKDMNFYQTQLSSEQLGEVSALINYQIGLMNLKLETLWDFEANRSVLNNE
ncbi:MAG: TolC family protein [Candidatus Zixiibacteriota bacterium]